MILKGFGFKPVTILTRSADIVAALCYSQTGTSGKPEQKDSHIGVGKKVFKNLTRLSRKRAGSRQ